MTEMILPKATAKRLPLYLRYLKMLNESGVKRIKSNEFSRIVQVPSASIRKDLSYLGKLGRRCYGYEVSYLIKILNQILKTEEEQRIALVGYGNLGKALRSNNFRENKNLNIVCVFDNDPKIVNQEIDGQFIYPIERFDEITHKKKATVAISTVPSKHSQSAIDEIVKSDISAILNFAPERVIVPENVNIQYIDLTLELQALCFNAFNGLSHRTDTK